MPTLPGNAESTIAELLRGGAVLTDAAGNPIRGAEQGSMGIPIDPTIRAKAVRVGPIIRPVELSLTVTVRSVVLLSWANIRTTSRAYIQHKKEVKEATTSALPRLVDPFPLPVDVAFVRLGGRWIDPDENLPMCFKVVKDTVAEYLGVSDDGRDNRVSWSFDQAPDWLTGFKITISTRRT